MHLFSWNINGIRAVSNNGKLDKFLDEYDPDVVCFQETKINEATLESSGIREKYDGYTQSYSFAEKKGYSGTAIWVKKETLGEDIEEMGCQLPEISDKYGSASNEGRLTAVDFGEFCLISVYVPNAKRDLSRLELREHWDKELLALVKKMKKPVIICGDFNVANEEIDLAHPKENRGKHGFTRVERAGFKALLKGAKLHDIFREENPELREAYTWWTHWGSARANNVGWRIDYFLVSQVLLPRVKKSEIYPSVFGSDHCPVGLELK